MACINFMIITNQKSTKHIQKLKKKESKQHTMKNSKPQRKKTREEETEDNRKSSLKQLTKKNKYILINNYFKCEWFKCSYKRHRVAKWIKKLIPSISCLSETLFKS